MTREARFCEENRKEIESVSAWVNGFIQRDDAEGAHNAAVVLQGIVFLVGQFITARAAEPPGMAS